MDLTIYLEVKYKFENSATRTKTIKQNIVKKNNKISPVL